MISTISLFLGVESNFELGNVGDDKKYLDLTVVVLPEWVFESLFVLGLIQRGQDYCSYAFRVLVSHFGCLNACFC